MADSNIVLSFRKYAASALDYILLSDRENKVRNILYSQLTPFL